MDIQQCANCRFCDNDGGVLECRRRAPYPITTSAFCTDADSVDKAAHQVAFRHWPGVREHDWCGEWEEIRD